MDKERIIENLLSLGQEGTWFDEAEIGFIVTAIQERDELLEGIRVLVQTGEVQAARAFLSMIAPGAHKNIERWRMLLAEPRVVIQEHDKHLALKKMRENAIDFRQSQPAAEKNLKRVKNAGDGNPAHNEFRDRLDRLEKCVVALVRLRESDWNVAHGYSPQDWLKVENGPWDELRKEETFGLVENAFQGRDGMTEEDSDRIFGKPGRSNQSQNETGRSDMIGIELRHHTEGDSVQVRIFSGKTGDAYGCNGVLAFTKDEWEALYLMIISHRLCVRREDGSLGEAILTPGRLAEIRLVEE
jgi:hypothetical protein